MLRGEDQIKRLAVLTSVVLMATAEALAQENRRPARRIVVSIPDRKLAVMEADRVVRIFPTAVGAPHSMFGRSETMWLDLPLSVIVSSGKLLPLLMLVVLGSFHLSKGVLAGQVVSNPNWTEAVLLLVFAYGGFESAVIAASETRNPKRDTAFALVTAIVAVTAVYLLVQLAVVGVLPHAAQSSTPIAAALAELLGPAGSTIAALGVVVSVYGWLTGFALMTPRILFSMARRREMPAFLAAVHPRFRTPGAAIAVNSAAVLVMGLSSNFAQAATLAAIARLVIFAVTCGTVIVFRIRDRAPEGFHIPCGTAVAVIGIAFSAWLLSTRSFAQGWILIDIMAFGMLFWSRFTRGKP